MNSTVNLTSVTLTSEQQQYDQALCCGIGRYHSDISGTNPRPLLGITWQGILALLQSPQVLTKGAGLWLIPSLLKTRRKADQKACGRYPVLIGECDHPTGALGESFAALLSALPIGCIFVCYTTASAKPDCQKFRYIVPMGEVLEYRQWLAAQRLLKKAVEGVGLPFDDALFNANQVSYLPTCPEGFYDYRAQLDGEYSKWGGRIRGELALMDVEDDLAAATASAVDAARDVRAVQNSEMPSVIELFNQQFSLTELLLKAGYSHKNGTFRHPRSKSGNFSAKLFATPSGKVVVNSLSSEDPLYGRGHDAYSAFCLLLGGSIQQASDLVQWSGKSYSQARLDMQNTKNDARCAVLINPYRIA